MPAPLQRTTKATPAGALITLSGVIDEAFDGDEVFAGASGVVAVDLDGVARITSFGVRGWIQALKKLGHLPYIGFVRCRPAIVSQFNMVKNFGGAGQLVSFYAPWRCPKCGHEFEQLVDLRRSHAEVQALGLPEARCPKCDTVAELDEVPEAYLSYAAAEPAPKPPPSFEQLLPGAVPDRLATFAVRKEVTDALTAIWLSGPLTSAARFKRLDDGLEGNVVVCCGQVLQVAAEGLEALLGLLHTPGPAMYLAQVPVVLAAALRARPDGAGRARVCSVMLPFRCPQCGKQPVREVNAGWLAALSEGRPDRPTCECGAGLVAAFTPDELRQARALNLIEPPPEISAWLAGAASSDARPAVPEPRAGAGEMFGRYQLVRQIGMGGMAEVSLARQTAIGGFEKKLVVKRILPQLSADPVFVQMFLQEARLAARISHPNVVQIFDVGQVGNRYFIAMEYVRGWDLAATRRVCRELDTPIPVELAAFIVSRICAGLYAAHSCVDDEGQAQPIIHRDVSPHNVLVSADGQVKLTDFGIAKAFGVGSLTPTATLKGKLSYMSPEQVRSESVIDPRSDLFSVGVMLHELLTLEHLFRRETEYATFEAILHDPVRRADAVRPDVPAALADIVERALHRDPAQRYQTGQELQKDLELFLQQPGRARGASDLGSWLVTVMNEGGAKGAQYTGPFTPTGQRTPVTDAGDREPTQPTISLVGLRKHPRPGPQVLLVHGAGVGLHDCAAVLQAMGTSFESRQALGELPPDQTHQLVIAHYDALSPDERARLTAAFAGIKATTRLLLVSEGQCRKDFVTLFGNQSLTNLLGRTGQVDTHELKVTVQKLLRPDLFGIERYLGPDAEVQSLKLSGSADKAAVLAEAEAFAARHSVPGRTRGPFLSVADELLTNAVFNAPVDPQGVYRFASLSRASPVELARGEEIDVKLAYDGRHLGLSVADPFGSLSQRTVMGYLAKCFRRGDDQVDEKPGGAGLGLYFLVESLSTLVVNLCPERRTEFIGLLDLRGSNRDFAQATRSFHLFNCPP